MADGTISFNTSLDNSQLEKALTATKKKIQSLNETIYKNEQQKLPLINQSKELAAALDTAKQNLFEMQNAPKGKFGADEIKEQKDLVRGLQSEYNQIENRIDSINRANEKANISLELEKEKAGALEIELCKAGTATKEMAGETKKSSAAMDKMEKRAARFSHRMSRIVSGALFFSLISRGLHGMVTWLGNSVKANDEAAASIATLKGALLTLAQPILNVVIPAFITLVNVAARVVSAIASLVSRIFGTTIQKSADAAKSLHNQEKAYGGVGKAAKDASKSIMGFDELNTLQAEPDDSGGGGSGVSASEIKPNFDVGFSDEIQSEMDKITVYVSGALLALGTILAFTGANIPLGIGLMAAGALGLGSVIAVNWNSMDDGLKTAINTVLLTLAAAGLVIGAILAFTSANIPLGIGMMAVGAVALGTAVAVNWDSISPYIAGSLAVLELLLGAALLGIGAVLAFTGVALPLGIAMMAAGAVGLARSQTADWNTLATALQGPIGKVTAIASGALLALGVILVFTGVGIPIGLGMLMAGCAGLCATVTANWDFITEKLSGVWDNVTNWFNTSVAPKLKLEYWKTKLAPIGQACSNMWSGVKETAVSIWDGIVSAILGAVNRIIGGINGMISGVVNGINLVSQALNAIGFDIPGWVPGFGGMRFGFNLHQLSAPQIPYLAQGAVIPPNKEFLAVLGDQSHGTNIEAPLSTIEEAVARVIGNPELLSLLLEQNDLLRQILAKCGITLDGRQLAEAILPHQKNMERARGW